jgi:hypothetical protein
VPLEVAEDLLAERVGDLDVDPDVLNVSIAEGSATYSMPRWASRTGLPSRNWPIP